MSQPNKHSPKPGQEKEKPAAGQGKKGGKRKGMCLEDRPILEPNAAGIDIGAREIFVAVAPDRAEDPVQVFSTFTEDLERMAQWLVSCGVSTVAMESTGVYWIPLYDVLEKHGIRPCLVDARGMKNVPGRRTDWHECQWLQFLHSVGLLRAAFRPDGEVCAVRSLMRHRSETIEMTSQHILHTQKAWNADECADPACDRRPDRSDRAGDCGCPHRRRARPGGTGQAARPAHQSQRRDDTQIAGGQLASGASIYAQAIA